MDLTNISNIVLGCFVRATKGRKTGGYTDGAHHPAMLKKLGAGESVGRTLLARICKRAGKRNGNNKGNRQGPD